MKSLEYPIHKEDIRCREGKWRSDEKKLSAIGDANDGASRDKAKPFNCSDIRVWWSVNGLPKEMLATLNSPPSLRELMVTVPCIWSWCKNMDESVTSERDPRAVEINFGSQTSDLSSEREREREEKKESLVLQLFMEPWNQKIWHTTLTKWNVVFGAQRPGHDPISILFKWIPST